MFYNKRYESSIKGWGMLTYPHLDYSWVKNKIGKRWFDRWQRHPNKSMNDLQSKMYGKDLPRHLAEDKLV